MIGIHRLTVYLLRPMSRNVEWKNLRRWKYEVIVSLEKSAHRLIPGAADRARFRDLVSSEPRTVLNLPLKLGFHRRSLGWIVVEFFESRADLRGANFKPIAPDLLDRKIRPRLFDDTSELFEYFERSLAQIEDTRLERQISAEVSKPRKPIAFEVAFERSRKNRRVLPDRKRHARVVARLDSEQHREIGNRPRHRSMHR